MTSFFSSKVEYNTLRRALLLSPHKFEIVYNDHAPIHFLLNKLSVLSMPQKIGNHKHCFLPQMFSLCVRQY